MKRRDKGGKPACSPFRGGRVIISPLWLLKSATNRKKTNNITPFCPLTKRSLDSRCIMDSSGEPVSKYRVKVLIPGRPEYILPSGQERRPAWDTAHFFSINSFEGGNLMSFDPKEIFCRSLPRPRRSSCWRVKAGADCPFGRFLTRT